MRNGLYLLSFAILSMVWTSGCSTSPGRGGFSLFPQGHKLTDSAKSMRDANARSLMVPRELDKQPLPAYTVEPGDALQVLATDLDSPIRLLPLDQPVLPDGTINLGKYGQLVVMGKTVSEIEAMVRGAVKTPGKDPPPISVRLIARQSKVYYVIGEVNSPGMFPLSGRETVLDALMQAGGLTDRASRDNIILSRPSKPDCPRIVLPVCWKQIVQLGDTTTNYQIAPGDRVYVPSRSTMEKIPLLNKHVKSPCMCDHHAPQAFPPHPGDACQVPSNTFRGNVEMQAPPLPEPILPPAKDWPPSSK